MFMLRYNPPFSLNLIPGPGVRLEANLDVGQRTVQQQLGDRLCHCLRTARERDN